MVFHNSGGKRWPKLEASGTINCGWEGRIVLLKVKLCDIDAYEKQGRWFDYRVYLQ